jgi:hypothetical protein
MLNKVPYLLNPSDNRSSSTNTRLIITLPPGEVHYYTLWFYLHLVGGSLPIPLPLSSLFQGKKTRLTLAGKGSPLSVGASPPHNISPSQTNEKWALKENLFERGSGGEPQKSTKTEQNPPCDVLCGITKGSRGVAYPRAVN